jgi:hypothetical protein
MSREMIAVHSFFDVQMNHHTCRSRTRANRYNNNPFVAPPGRLIPRLHLNH